MSLDLLHDLIARCKCGVHLTVNDHRDVYESVEQTLANLGYLAAGIPDEVRAEMIARDTIVDVHFYPDTPIGFYKILHYDLDEALRLALQCFDKR